MLLPFVLENTLEEITGYPNVERMAAAGHDVRAIGVLVHWLIVRFVGEEGWERRTTADPSLPVRDDNVFWGRSGRILPPVIQKLYHYIVGRASLVNLTNATSP